MKSTDRPNYGEAHEAECALLGSILLAPAVGASVDDYVREDDFFFPGHRAIFRVLRSVPEGLDIAQATVRLRQNGDYEEVGGSVKLAALMQEVPTALNAESYAKEVHEAAVRRRLVRLGLDFTATAAESPRKSADIIEEFGAKLLAVETMTDSGEIPTLAEIMPDVLDDLEREQNAPSGVTGIETGFVSVNDLTGGWQRGSQYVIGARPSVGKTTFVLTTALKAARAGKVVLFVSAEMSAKDIARNALCHLGGVASTMIRSGRLTHFAWTRITEAANEAGSMNLFLDGTPNPTVAQIRNRARRLKLKKHGLDLIAVDYLQLVRGVVGDNREQQVAAISRALKALARELDVPVITLAQLNRAPTGRRDPRPQLSDLRESGSIEADADMVILLHPKVDTPEAQAEPVRAVEAIVAKNRNGRRGTVQLTLVAAEFRFEETAAT